MGKAVKEIRGSGGSKFAKPAGRRFASPIDKAKGYEVIWHQVAPLFEVARPIPDVPYVYVIGEADGPVKIGTSKDPVGRLRQMQTGNPRRLRIEHVLIGECSVEKLLHEIWAEYAIQAAGRIGKVDSPPGTEWFKTEIREKLEPIMVTACEKHIALIDAVEPEDLDPQNFISAVHEAHGEHDFVARKRHVTLYLGATVGTVPGHRSRL